MTIVVAIVLSCSDDDTKAVESLEKYSNEIADLADEAMQSQVKNGNVPDGVKYEGVEAYDADEDEEDGGEDEEVEILDQKS